MRLSAPKQVVFCISVILLVIGLVVHLTTLSFFPGDAFWITFAGGVLLTLGSLLKGF
jgi:predicted membrane channel-forming protein YqfA (hemolysin III family)